MGRCRDGCEARGLLPVRAESGPSEEEPELVDCPLAAGTRNCRLAGSCTAQSGSSSSPESTWEVKGHLCMHHRPCGCLLQPACNNRRILSVLPKCPGALELHGTSNAGQFDALKQPQCKATGARRVGLHTPPLVHRSGSVDRNGRGAPEMPSQREPSRMEKASSGCSEHRTQPWLAGAEGQQRWELQRGTACVPRAGRWTNRGLATCGAGLRVRGTVGDPP